MNLSTRSLSKCYELSPLGGGSETDGIIIFNRRVILGRLENCDLIIKDSSISGIHAVIEISEEGGRVYDMNSELGTKVNGEKIVCRDIKIGDKISFGNQEFLFQEYQKSSSLPPVLDSSSPSEEKDSFDRASEPKPRPSLPTPPSFRKPKRERGDQVPGTKIDPRQIIVDDPKKDVPYISYPLAKDPQAEFSEYIFEDVDNIYPIFKWSMEKGSAEVIILHKGRIFSVDYLPSRKNPYFIKGMRGNKDGVEFPYLRKNESIPFIQVSSGTISLEDSLGCNGVLISDNMGGSENFKEKKIQAPLTLGPNDILKLKKGDLQIFIRNTESPPQIKPAPMFRRDNPSRKYFLIFSALLALLFFGISQIVINKEIEKEKQPDRLATIIYNKKKYIAKKKTIKKPKVIVKKPAKPKVNPSKPKPRPKKIAKPKSIPKKIVKPKPRPKKIAKTKPKIKNKITKPKNRITKKVIKKVLPKRKSTKKTASGTKRSTQKKISKKSNAGSSEGYKISSRLKSRFSKITSKGGKVVNVQKETYGSEDIAQGGSGALQGGSSSIKTVKLRDKVGSLQSATTGSLDRARGAEGLVDKKEIASVEIPSRTVVLGDYDSTRVSEILMGYLSQFRACYETELGALGRKVSGKMELHFKIGPRGFVSNAGVSRSEFSSSLDGCVLKILKGIKFPEPQGGGVVAIRQPMFFEPRL